MLTTQEYTLQRKKYVEDHLAQMLNNEHQKENLIKHWIPSDHISCIKTCLETYPIGDIIVLSYYPPGLSDDMINNIKVELVKIGWSVALTTHHSLNTGRQWNALEISNDVQHRNSKPSVTKKNMSKDVGHVGLYIKLQAWNLN